MINPSDLNLSALPSVSLAERSQLPATPCIYFAIDSLGEVQYIGRSVNPAQRWTGHHRYEQLNKLGGVAIAYLFVDSADLLPSIEAALIAWFAPPLNRKGLGRKKSEYIQIAIDPDDKRAFDAWCAQNSTTMSEVLRKQIAPYIAKGRKILDSADLA